MKCVVVHGGPAHRDEFYAVCMILGALSLAGNGPVPIFRRDPAPDEMSDAEVLKVDVGGAYNGIDKFDHHQDKSLDAAFRLIAVSLLKWDPALMDEIFPWARLYSALDTRGPFATAAEYHMPAQSLLAAMDPVADALLDSFAWSADRAPRTAVTDTATLGMLAEIGKGWIRNYRMAEERLGLLRKEAKIVEVRPGEGRPAVRGIYIPETVKNPTFVVEVFRRRLMEPAEDKLAFCISRDERGPGWSLYRFEDDPRIDFNRISGDRRVAFAHKGGFIAKTGTMDWREALELVKAAVVVTQ